jgi:hypothetical protein
VVYVVLDDVGFGALSCYGGLIDTPNIDRIAAAGLRYTQWHTTALCSPTRSCLLTGRNHTTNGMACHGVARRLGVVRTAGQLTGEDGVLPLDQRVEAEAVADPAGEAGALQHQVAVGAVPAVAEDDLLGGQEDVTGVGVARQRGRVVLLVMGRNVRTPIRAAIDPTPLWCAASPGGTNAGKAARAAVSSIRSHVHQ